MVLPGLRTDIVLTTLEKKIVVETKYMPEPFHKRFGKTMLRSAHLNQIFAYMQNVAARDHIARPVEGILLYPATEKPFRLQWTLFGRPLTSAAVDLSATWKDIETQLLQLVNVPIGGTAPHIS